MLSSDNCIFEIRKEKESTRILPERHESKVSYKNADSDIKNLKGTSCPPGKQ